MASAGILVLVLLAQVLVSGFGARRLAPHGIAIAWLSCLAVPAIALLFAVVMIFDVSGMSDSGARIIVPLAIGLLFFTFVGLGAAAIGYRSTR